MAHDAHKRIHNPHKQLQNANPQLNELLPVTNRVPTLHTAVRLVVMFQMRCLFPSLNKGGGIPDICLLLLLLLLWGGEEERLLVSVPCFKGETYGRCILCVWSRINIASKF
jgi:hypothetical protein